MAYMDGSDDSDGDGDHRIETLLRDRTFLKDVVVHDGTGALLSAVNTDDGGVQLPIVRALERLAAQPESAHDIRQIGGINVLLALLSSRCLTPWRASAVDPPKCASHQSMRVGLLGLFFVLFRRVLSRRAPL